MVEWPYMVTGISIVWLTGVDGEKPGINRKRLGS